jgi:hypothetical protein
VDADPRASVSVRCCSSSHGQGLGVEENPGTTDVLTTGVVRTPVTVLKTGFTDRRT